MYNIPVLFVFFNRKDVAKNTFNHIKKVQPSKLYLASDGPRESIKQEQEVVEKIRKEILELIDWPCDVKTRFLTSNLGCSLGVSTAVSWMFESEDCGIVLEDDCVPTPGFFFYVKEMLNKYREDNRIGLIAGFNPIASRIKIEDSYCFSNYKSTWGWATWKRSWNNFDINMSWRNKPVENSILSNMGLYNKDVNYWVYRIRAIDSGYVSSWDWQWFMSLSAQNQLTIYPKYNLISNIGFGKDSTHTVFNIRGGEITSSKDLEFPLQHPKYVIPNFEFEKAFHKRNNTFFNLMAQLLPFSVRSFIKKMLIKIKG